MKKEKTKAAEFEMVDMADPEQFDVSGVVRDGMSRDRKLNFDHIVLDPKNYIYDFVICNDVNNAINMRQGDGWRVWKSDNYGLTEFSKQQMASRAGDQTWASVPVGEAGNGTGTGIGYLMHIPNRHHPSFQKGSTASKSVAPDGGHINDIEHAERRKAIRAQEARSGAGLGAPADFTPKVGGNVGGVYSQSSGYTTNDGGNIGAGINQISST